MSCVRVYLALGRVAHEAVLLARGLRRADFPFAHAGEHLLAEGVHLIDSYHCSRYNTQTRRLTGVMFRQVVARACELAQLPVPPRLKAA
jgi:uracil-DNA glycosylase